MSISIQTDGTISIETVTMTATATATATATETATATAMEMTKISQSYRAWLVPALGIKGAAIRLFLFKQSDHVESNGNNIDDSYRRSSSKSDSNSDDDEKDISVK